MSSPIQSESPQKMFDDILVEIVEGSRSGQEVFNAGKAKLEKNIAFLTTVNQCRMCEVPEDNTTLVNEHACLVDSSAVILSFEQIVAANKMQLQMKCRILDRIAQSMFNDPELARLQQVEYDSLGTIHELEKQLKQKESLAQDLARNMVSLDEARKEEERKTHKFKVMSIERDGREKSLKEEIKLVQNEARREISKLEKKLEASIKEKEKAMREWTDMKAKNSELEAELKKIKLTAEMAVKHKEVQEKSIFEMKGEMASLQTAMEEIKISRKGDEAAFSKSQESNIQKIKRLENEKDLLAGKKTEAENLARSISSSLKVTKNFSDLEVTSLIQETIFNMRPDGVVATELDGMFTVIAQETSINKSEIFDRVMEYADHKRDSPLSEETEKEAFSKISRYFRIMRDQNYSVFGVGRGGFQYSVDTTDQVAKTHSSSLKPGAGRGRGSGKPEGASSRDDLQEYFKQKYGH